MSKGPAQNNDKPKGQNAKDGELVWGDDPHRVGENPDGTTVKMVPGKEVFGMSMNELNAHHGKDMTGANLVLMANVYDYQNGKPPELLRAGATGVDEFNVAQRLNAEVGAGTQATGVHQEGPHVGLSSNGGVHPGLHTLKAHSVIDEKRELAHVAAGHATRAEVLEAQKIINAHGGHVKQGGIAGKETNRALAALKPHAP